MTATEITYNTLIEKGNEWKLKANEYQPMDADDNTAYRWLGKARECFEAADKAFGRWIFKASEDDNLIKAGCAQRRVNAARQFTQYDDDSQTETRWFDSYGDEAESFTVDGVLYYAVQMTTEAMQTWFAATSAAHDVTTSEAEIVSANEAKSLLNIKCTAISNPIGIAMRNGQIEGAHKAKAYKGGMDQWVATWGAIKTWWEAQPK